MKYWVRLLSIESKYVQEAHINYLHQDQTNKNGWCKIIDYLLTYTDMKHKFTLEAIISKPKIFIEGFKCKLICKYQQYWKEVLNSNKETKLNFYKTIKKNYYFEQYLDVLDKGKRMSISRIRLSSHNFPIERMRYTKTKQEERICKICNLNQVGDEMHYLLNCTNTKIETQRKEFINDIKNVQPQFSHFEHINIIKYCLNMADSLIFNPFANFINNILNTYKEEEQNISNGNFNNKSCDIM